MDNKSIYSYLCTSNKRFITYISMRSISYTGRKKHDHSKVLIASQAAILMLEIFVDL